MRPTNAMSMLTDDADHFGGEYQVVAIRPSWSVLSLGSAAIAVLSRPILSRILLDWFAWQSRDPWNWPLAVTGFSVAFAATGLLFGIVGMRARVGRSRSLATLAVVANVTILSLVVAMAVIFSYIRWR